MKLMDTDLTTRQLNTLMFCANAGKTVEETGVPASPERDKWWARFVKDAAEDPDAVFWPIND